MRILAINCGSSTLKFQLFDVGEGGSETRLARGLVDRIGLEGATATFQLQGKPAHGGALPTADHQAALGQVVEWLKSAGLLEGELAAVGHRVVHGADRFAGPARLDEAAVRRIEALSELAPLHNQPSLAAIRAARLVLDPQTPMVAVFDTSFHRGMPEHAARYAIPAGLTEKYAIRRYGFHGLAHQCMAERAAELAGRPLGELKLITLQLGNGCSAAAVAGGRSVDCSMGFTPLEGLMMGTRSGDLDPALVGFLAQHERVDVAAVEEWLNRQSGLLGVSGVSRDMRTLLELAGQGHAAAAMAIEMFCYRVRKYIGAYLAVLNGADAVVFGGGIGENAAAVREQICARLEWCGLELDPGRNANLPGGEGMVSVHGSRVAACVVRVDEERIIARETARCLAT